MLGPSSLASSRFAARQGTNHALRRGYVIPASVTSSHIADRTPGAPASSDYKEPKRSAAEVKSSTLENGIKVVTVDNGAPSSAVGLFVRSGPRFESAEEVGVSHFVRHLAFTRTNTRSPVTVVRDMEAYSNQFACSTGREQISYTAKALTENLPAVVYMFNDLLSPRLHEYILRDASEDIYREAVEAETNPETVLIEALHREAFRNVGLGRSRYAPSYRTGKISPQLVGGFLARTYVPQNAAVVGVGVEHNAFVGLVKEVVTSLPSGTAQKANKAEYVGGDARLPSDDNTRIAIAFRGLSENDTDAAALSVFTHLVGGDAKYSRDGPGRGVTTRLYKNVVEKLAPVRAAAALNTSYSDAGLWTVYAEAERGNVKAVADALSSELATLRKGGFDAKEVAGAKNRAKAAFLSYVDTSCGLLSFAGRQALSGADACPLRYAAKFDAVTPDDVARVAKAVLSSEPTVVVTGDVEGTPTTKAFRA